MNCSYCNTPLRDGARFCQACGKAIVHTGVGFMSNPFDHLRSPQTEERQIITISNAHRLTLKASFVVELPSQFDDSSANLPRIPMPLKFSSDYSRILQVSELPGIGKFKISIINTFSGLTLTDIPSTYGFYPVQISHDNKKILIGKKIHNCLDGSVLNEVTPKFNNNGVVMITGDLQKYFQFQYGIASLFSGLELAYRDLKGGVEVNRFKLRSGIMPNDSDPFTHISHDSSKVLIMASANSSSTNLSTTVLFLDTLSSDILNIDQPDLIQARFSKDDKSIFLSSMDRAFIFSIQSKELVFSDRNSFGITASLDNSVIFLLHKDDTVQAYNAKDMKNICKLKSKLPIRRFLHGNPTNPFPTRIDIGIDGTILAISSVISLFPERREIELWAIS